VDDFEKNLTISALFVKVVNVNVFNIKRIDPESE
jgi:hypothetical protein